MSHRRNWQIEKLRTVHQRKNSHVCAIQTKAIKTAGVGGVGRLNSPDQRLHRLESPLERGHAEREIGTGIGVGGGAACWR